MSMSLECLQATRLYRDLSGVQLWLLEEDMHKKKHSLTSSELVLVKLE